MKKIAILQSNYIPWKGVFDMINSVDTFVFLEDVKYTEHDWRNRNKILVGNEEKWLSVPIKNSGRRGQKIYETEIETSSKWQRKHYNSFEINYSKAKYYKEFKWILEQLYLNKQWTNLSELNIYAIKLICNVLGIKTEFINSIDLDCKGIKDDKIIEICKKLKATTYLSGPAAKNYIIPQKFKDNNILLEYIDYYYLEYEQIKGEFVTHGVTILDLIFNCGIDSSFYIWGWKDIKKI